MVKAKHRLELPYLFLLCIFVLFTAFAFIIDTPADIWNGLIKITFSCSLLITDYILVGGMGGAFINAALTGMVSLMMMHFFRVKPNGAIIMALFLATGFSFFGKNLFNTIPILLGVWLYSRLQREPFINYSLISLLSFTLAPVVSQIAFRGVMNPWLEILFGQLSGIGIGLIMPVVSSAVTRVHSGYDLYNVGFAGGLIALFLAAGFSAVDIELLRPEETSVGNNLPLAILLYGIMAAWILLGILSKKRKENLKNFKLIHTHSGRLVTDYYLLYNGAAYINMGVMGMLGTTLTLVLGAQLNGVTLAGIFTMAGFGAFGKHLRNCVPVLIGAIAAALINSTTFNDSANLCAILFSTGLAPIAGQYGFVWGIVAGLLHVPLVPLMGELTGGLNLYNNGFAGGFVALLLVPAILAVRQHSGAFVQFRKGIRIKKGKSREDENETEI